MPVHALQHFLVRTSRFEQTRRFYVELLGMREGPRPDFPFPGAWLYLGETPCVHLVDTSDHQGRRDYLAEDERGLEAGAGTGAIDHLGFVATDLDGVLARLQERNVPYRRRQVENMVQIFITDPNGIEIELNFETGQ